MYNTDMPTRAELPTTKQLIRSTLIALSTAMVLLVTVILPAEYAIDPTGLGKVLSLTDMGEIKAQLEQEAAEDEARTKALVASKAATKAPEVVTQVNEVVDAQINTSVETKEIEEPVWRDRKIISLEPGQGAEVKLVMNKGQIAQFEWTSKGGAVNHDTHGDGNGKSISYKKGRGVPSGEGDLVAAFDGSHGWFFRNRNESKIMVILKTNGDYAQIKRVL